MGVIALAGGAEFRPNCDAMDRALLTLTGQAQPRVVILPTAAVRGSPRLAGENGVRHFTRLGAQASAPDIVTRADADDPQPATRLADADIVYLAGGDPAYLLETLRDSVVWRAIVEVYQRGGIVAGASAGAMVLAEVMGPPQTSGWVAALGLAPGVAVLPHHDPAAHAARIRHARAGLDARIAILGLPEASGAVTHGDGRWLALGVAATTVYEASGQTHVAVGQSFSL